MATRIGGARRKSRDKLRQSIRQKGKFSLTQYFQEIPEQTKVQLVLNSGFAKGRFDHKFYGKIGIVVGKTGDCYKIQVMDYNKNKTIIAHPIHIKRVK